MKKFLAIMIACLFLMMSGVVFAGGHGLGHGSGHHKDPVGWYYHTVTGEYKYFKKGHHCDPSQWIFIGGNKCDKPGDYTATATPIYSNIKSESDYDQSLHGWGNDWASSYAEGGFSGEMTLFANGKYNASVGGTISNCCCGDPFAFTGYTDADAFAHAWDYGKKSGAKAGSSIEGYVQAGGYAYGREGLDEIASGSLTFGGYLQEQTVAQEIGYPYRSGISSSQFTSIEFSETVQMCSSPSGKYVTGYLSESPNGVFGKSLASIDNTGSFRSIEGSTFSKAYGPGETTVNMNGLVNGYISDGQSLAGGLASYSVNNGSANLTIGQANLKATIYNMGSSAGTVTVTVNTSAGAGLVD